MREQVFKFIDKVSSRLAHPYTTLIVFIMYLVWLGLFPFLPFEVWQMLMDVPTTALGLVILAFLTTAQDRDNKATQTKLDVILERIPGDNSEAEGIEQLSEREVDKLHKKLAPASCDDKPDLDY